jgi:hypothetical protein
MPKNHVVIIEPEHEQVAADLNARLQAWNEQQVGPRRTRHFTLSIRHDDAVIAGLTGELQWNVCT